MIYSITYLPTEDRKRLRELQDKLSQPLDSEKYQKYQQEIIDIQAKQKVLGQCNIDECMALKTQMFEQYNKLLGIGRTTHARQYSLMIRSIEGRIHALIMEQKSQSTEIINSSTTKKKRKKSDGTSGTSTKTGSVPNRWTIQVDDAD